MHCCLKRLAGLTMRMIEGLDGNVPCQSRIDLSGLNR